MLCLQWTQYFLNGFTEHLKPQRIASMYFNTISVIEAIKTIGNHYCFYFQGSGWGSQNIITFTLVLVIKKYLWPFNIKLNPNTALRRTIIGRASFFNARLFFVVLGVQNWVPIEHGHIYRIINTSDNTTQRNMKSTHRTSAEKIIWTQVCLFCCLFCCCFLDLFFFGGGAVGWGWVRFLGWGGAGIQCNATLTQSIALRSAIVGRENLIAGGLFVLF